MQILTEPTAALELDQEPDKLRKLYMCIFDYADAKNRDFRFINIRQFLSYHFPTASLLVDGKYHYVLPLNWNILTGEPEEGECVLTTLDMLLHRQMYTPLVNPFYASKGRMVTVEITKVNPINVEHFVPKLPSKSVLMLPIGNRNTDCIESIDFKTKESVYYPLCLMGADSSVAGKCLIDFYSEIIN